MIKFKENGLIYYFANEELFNESMLRSSSEFRLKANASYIIDTKTNEFVKARSSLEDLIDDAMTQRTGIEPVLMTKPVVDWDGVTQMVNNIINLMSIPNTSGNCSVGCCHVNYDSSNKHISIVAPRGSGKTSFMIKMVQRCYHKSLLIAKFRNETLHPYRHHSYILRDFDSLRGRIDLGNAVVYLDEFSNFSNTLDSYTLPNRPIQVRISS